MAAFPPRKFETFPCLVSLSSHMTILFFISTFTAYSCANVQINCNSFETFYSAGINAYRGDRWFECYSELKNADSAYKCYKKKIVGCRKYCQDDSRSPGDIGSNIEEEFLQISLYRSDCLRKCFSSKDINQNLLRSSAKTDLDSLIHYDYLQLCAYKVEKYEDAVAAAYTFHLANPDHEIMRDNIDYYRLVPEIHSSFFVDLEKKTYQSAYDEGVRLYNAEQYLLVTVEMERALTHFYTEAEQCRLLCEDPFDHESFPQLYNAIADHWVSVVRCRQRCELSTSTYEGEYMPRLLAEMYNYLQFSYYKSGDYEKAASACASYLLFFPDDGPMVSNQKYYQQDLGVDFQLFVPTPEAAEYHTMLEAERRMADFINTRYTFSDADLDSQGRDIPEQPSAELFPDPYGDTAAASPLLSNSQFPHLSLGSRTPEFLESLETFTRENGLTVAQEEEALQGPTRVLVDGVVSDDECSTLIELAQLGGTQGDGYTGTESRSSPHTDYEQFVGITVAKAAQLAVSGEVSTAALETYLRASQAARTFIEKYNNLQTPLHFHYTHLVCRTALQEQEGREDLSHPIHADNCLLQEDGSCLKQRPAYTQRDFSALLYLNDDFEGGDFFFAHANQSQQVKVRPQCGRMVGFESGTYHGVEAVTGGRRCALALWYTLDSTQQEHAHREAQLMLRGIASRARPLENPALKSMVEQHGYDIVMTESELNGPERFAADNVVSPRICQDLIDLAVQSAVDNDGYSHRGALQSPQSQHENFSGLTLNKAAESAGKENEGYGQKGGLSSPHSKHEQYRGTTVNRAAKEEGSEGDVYITQLDGSSFSHSQHELFSGLSVLRAAQLVEDKKLSPALVHKFLKYSRDSKDLVQAYFNLSSPLYFDYTHLVCRTARNKENKDRTDLSHPIHSDNCLIRPDGTCLKERPAYIQRDYSALLYLNGDFEGGEFIFTDTDFSIQASLRPQCGRLVGFNASNYHGVKAVLSGRRCALAMWYTLDAAFDERAHGVARDVLRKQNFQPPKDEL